ncbi:MAG: hypothetical protein AAFN06_18465, partial [Pseudomonadota bacterium]
MILRTGGDLSGFSAHASKPENTKTIRKRRYGRKISKLLLTKVSQGSRRAALFFFYFDGGWYPTFWFFKSLD